MKKINQRKSPPHYLKTCWTNRWNSTVHFNIENLRPTTSMDYITMDYCRWILTTVQPVQIHIAPMYQILSKISDLLPNMSDLNI